MRRMILTGAGFSKNWNGFLAREVWERLLGHTSVRSTPELRRPLLNHIADFETALQEVRQLSNELAQKLEAALLDVFMEQDELHRGDTGEYSNSFNPTTFDSFFERFRSPDGTGLLFTLNQDLFLERRFRGRLVAPGVGPVSIDAGADPLLPSHWQTVPEGATATLATGELNYLKLHGSFNWQTAAGGQLLVAGGDKVNQLGSSFPLLRQYLDRFRTACTEHGAWLLVVGYRFRDEHINSAIADGVQAGLRVVIVDPVGPEPYSVTGEWVPH